ncbi:chemerin-like receptor 1 [Leptodactylus fuscus]|uniref:chemerin-like receptor 1 n=1 Tax=Leptodactylus fuscus TaxID=238119 RepID=UPI003F4F15FF
MYNSTEVDIGYGEESSSNYGHRINVSYIVIHAVTCLLGITGNGLVIWFGIFRMKKTVSLVWFLSLAVADFIFALLLPFIITYKILDHWPFGSFMCKSSVFFYNFAMSVIALQLVVLSVDRCVRIAFPQWCDNHRTRRWALIVVLIIWILSSASCVVFFIFTDTSDYNSRVSCQFRLGRHGIKWNVIIRSVFLLLVPFLVTLCSYIGVTLYSLIKHVPLCSRSFTVTLVVSIVFFLCSSPYYTFHILMMANTIDYYYVDKVAEITEILRVIGSCINPIIYVLVGWEVKDNFCSSFQAMFEKAFAEDEQNISSNKRQDRTDSLNLEVLSH